MERLLVSTMMQGRTTGATYGGTRVPGYYNYCGYVELLNQVIFSWCIPTLNKPFQIFSLPSWRSERCWHMKFMKVSTDYMKGLSVIHNHYRPASFGAGTRTHWRWQPIFDSYPSACSCKCTFLFAKHPSICWCRNVHLSKSIPVRAWCGWRKPTKLPYNWCA